MALPPEFLANNAKRDAVLAANRRRALPPAAKTTTIPKGSSFLAEAKKARRAADASAAAGQRHVIVRDPLGQQRALKVAGGHTTSDVRRAVEATPPGRPDQKLSPYSTEPTARLQYLRDRQRLGIVTPAERREAATIGRQRTAQAHTLSSNGSLIRYPVEAVLEILNRTLAPAGQIVREADWLNRGPVVKDAQGNVTRSYGPGKTFTAPLTSAVVGGTHGIIKGTGLDKYLPSGPGARYTTPSGALAERGLLPAGLPGLALGIGADIAGSIGLPGIKGLRGARAMRAARAVDAKAVTRGVGHAADMAARSFTDAQGGSALKRLIERQGETAAQRHARITRSRGPDLPPPHVSAPEVPLTRAQRGQAVSPTQPKFPQPPVGAGKGVKGKAVPRAMPYAGPGVETAGKVRPKPHPSPQVRLRQYTARSAALRKSGEVPEVDPLAAVGDVAQRRVRAAGLNPEDATTRAHRLTAIREEAAAGRAPEFNAKDPNEAMAVLAGHQEYLAKTGRKRLPGNPIGRGLPGLVQAGRSAGAAGARVSQAEEAVRKALQARAVRFAAKRAAPRVATKGQTATYEHAFTPGAVDTGARLPGVTTRLGSKSRPALPPAVKAKDVPYQNLEHLAERSKATGRTARQVGARVVARYRALGKGQGAAHVATAEALKSHEPVLKALSAQEKAQQAVERTHAALATHGNWDEAGNVIDVHSLPKVTSKPIPGSIDAGGNIIPDRHPAPTHGTQARTLLRLREQQSKNIQALVKANGAVARELGHAESVVANAHASAAAHGATLDKNLSADLNAFHGAVKEHMAARQAYTDAMTGVRKSISEGRKGLRVRLRQGTPAAARNQWQIERPTRARGGSTPPTPAPRPRDITGQARPVVSRRQVKGLPYLLGKPTNRLANARLMHAAAEARVTDAVAKQIVREHEAVLGQAGGKASATMNVIDRAVMNRARTFYTKKAARQRAKDMAAPPATISQRLKARAFHFSDYEEIASQVAEVTKAAVAAHEASPMGFAIGFGDDFIPIPLPDSLLSKMLEKVTSPKQLEHLYPGSSIVGRDAGTIARGLRAAGQFLHHSLVSQYGPNKIVAKVALHMDKLAAAESAALARDIGRRAAKFSKKERQMMTWMREDGHGMKSMSDEDWKRVTPEMRAFAKELSDVTEEMHRKFVATGYPLKALQAYVPHIFKPSTMQRFALLKGQFTPEQMIWGSKPSFMHSRASAEQLDAWARKTFPKAYKEVPWTPGSIRWWNEAFDKSAELAVHDDLASLTIMRGWAHHRAMADMATVRVSEKYFGDHESGVDLGGHFGTNVDEKTGAITGGMEYYGQKISGPFAIPGVKVRQDVVDTLNNISNARFVASRRMMQFAANANSYWKRLALMTLGYDVRNLMGDMFLAAQTGHGAFRPLYYGIRTAMGKGKVYKGLKEEARIYGVSGSGLLPHDTKVTRRGHFESAYLASYIARAPGIRGTEFGNWFYGRSPQNLRIAREDLIRRGVYAQMRRQGVNPIHAASETNRALYDYADVGRAIDILRRYPTGIPFGTWLAKNIPGQVRNITSRPQTVVRYGALKNNLDAYTDKNDPMAAMNIESPLLKQQAALKIPGMGYVSIQPPISDLNYFGPATMPKGYGHGFSVPLPFIGNREFGPPLAAGAWNDWTTQATRQLGPFFQMLDIVRGRNPMTGGEFFPRQVTRPEAWLRTIGEKTGVSRGITGSNQPVFVYDPKTGERKLVEGIGGARSAALNTLFPVLGSVARSSQFGIEGKNAPWRSVLATQGGISNAPFSDVNQAIKTIKYMGKPTGVFGKLSEEMGKLKSRLRATPGGKPPDVKTYTNSLGETYIDGANLPSSMYPQVNKINLMLAEVWKAKRVYDAAVKSGNAR